MVVYAGVVSAVAAAALLVFLARKRMTPPVGQTQVLVFGSYSPVLTWARQRVVVPIQASAAELQGRLGASRLSNPLEIFAIGIWALWVGRSFLDFDPMTWPIGREFGLQVYGFHFWDQLWRCGLCSLWNGTFNGGAPFLADPFTGALHPISAVAGSLAGAVSGAKLTFVASIWMAGIAQWWIGKTIGLGRWSRLWTALAATSGGHILGRMELGSVNLVISTAASSLALAGAIDLAVHRSRGAALRLAIVLALAIVSGVGYLQTALLFWAPWIALIATSRRGSQGHAGREFALAGALAVMMAGVFLVPFAHAWPSLAKFTDAAFQTSQPFEYVPLNLVIHDWDYYLAGGLGSTAFPYLHTLYIGWPAIILAAVGLAKSRPDDRHLLASLSLGAVTMFWLASGVPFRWAVAFMPGLAGIRHVALMAGLAVPAILAIAGYGLDRMLDSGRPVAEATVGLNENRVRVSFRLVYLLAIPLAAVLVTADQFGRNFLATFRVDEAYRAIRVLKTQDLQWVSPPFGEHYWVEPAIAEGLKLTNAVTPFWWDGRLPPPPWLEAPRVGAPAGLLPVAHLDDIPVFHHPENVYALVESPSGTVPCAAQGLGGDLTVICESGGGTLVVRENAWVGWTAAVNGQVAELGPGPWLEVNVPAGPVEVRFRYLPLDALVGGLLTLIGVVLVLVLGIRAGRSREAAHSEGSAADQTSMNVDPGLSPTEPSAPGPRLT